MARWYLMGELSDPEPELQQDLAAMGVGWKVVPKTAHAMGPENPAGLAQVVAEVVAASLPGCPGAEDQVPCAAPANRVSRVIQLVHG